MSKIIIDFDVNLDLVKYSEVCNNVKNFMAICAKTVDYGPVSHKKINIHWCVNDNEMDFQANLANRENNESHVTTTDDK